MGFHFCLLLFVLVCFCQWNRSVQSPLNFVCKSTKESEETSLKLNRINKSNRIQGWSEDTSCVDVWLHHMKMDFKFTMLQRNIEEKMEMKIEKEPLKLTCFYFHIYDSLFIGNLSKKFQCYQKSQQQTQFKYYTVPSRGHIIILELEKESGTGYPYLLVV